MTPKKTTFKKICRRCGETYITNARFSKFCDDCKLPAGGGNENKKM